MICKICGVNETDNPDDICNDCKASLVLNEDIEDIPQNEEKIL